MEEGTLTEEDQDFVVADSEGSDEGGDGTLHALVDARHRAQGPNAPFVAPYFPLAFAVSPDKPLQFNFDLRLLDYLRLPCPILSRDSNLDATVQGTPGEGVTFDDVREAVDYCRRELLAGWSVSSDQGRADEVRSKKNQGHSHPELDKEQMFPTEGKALDTELTSGREELDANLSKVRLDR